MTARSPLRTSIRVKSAIFTFGVDAEGRVLAAFYAVRPKTMRIIEDRRI